PRPVGTTRRFLAARGRRRAPPRAVHRLPPAHWAAARREARLPVPRRRAQGDRRVRERCRGHAGVGAALHDRARPLRHQLPADRHGAHDRRLRVRGPSRLAVAHHLACPVDPGDRRHRVRGDPLRGPAYGLAPGAPPHPPPPPPPPAPPPPAPPPPPPLP